MYLKFKKLIDKFSITFEHKPYVKSIDDESGFNLPPTSGDWVEVTEVLLPFDQSTLPSTKGHSTGSYLSSGGLVETADMVIYTNNTYQLKDQFRWHGQIFEVIASNDYSGYSDVIIYFLKGVSGQNGDFI